MSECADDVSSGPTLTGQACCVRDFIAPAVSTTYLKAEHERNDILPTTSFQAFSVDEPLGMRAFAFDAPPAFAAYSPPLYLTLHALLI